MNSWTLYLLLGSFIPVPARPITSVTCEGCKVEVTYASPVKHLPPIWILGQKDFSVRVMSRLQKAEAEEVNLHYKQDIRQAWITTSLAQKGVPEPFVEASYGIYGLHPSKVWPSIVADRKARLGAEYYDWYTSADILRPDVPKIPTTADADNHAANGASLHDWEAGPVPTDKEVM